VQEALAAGATLDFVDMGQSRPNSAVGTMSGLIPSATELWTSLMVWFVPISDIVRSVCNEKDTEPLLPGRHGAMSSMSKRLVNLIRCIFRLLAFASPRAAGIILSSRAASAAIMGTYSPVAALA
jgi:hypothetical protein